MKCIICQKEYGRRNGMKRHINHIHKELNTLEVEKAYLKTCANLTDVEVEMAILDYKDGFTRDEIKEKYGISFINLFTILKIRRTNSESKRTKKYIEKYTNTIKEKYGVTNISKSEKIKKIKNETFLKNHGYINNFCNPEIQSKAISKIDHKAAWEKSKQGLIEKYGVDNPSKIPEVQAKIKKSCKARLEKMSFEEKQEMTRIARESFTNSSSLEQRVEKALLNYQVTFRKNVSMFKYNYDFVFDDLKVIIEIQGDYWHANPKIYNENSVMIGGKLAKELWAKDLKKKNIAEENGFKVFYFWEKDIRGHPDSVIEDFLQNNILNYDYTSNQ
jgi:very-short-patch-repair endonuclease